MDKKELKVLKDSLQTSISNAEAAKTLAISQGNKTASESARRVEEALKRMLASLKGPK